MPFAILLPVIAPMIAGWRSGRAMKIAEVPSPLISSLPICIVAGRTPGAFPGVGTVRDISLEKG